MEDTIDYPWGRVPRRELERRDPLRGGVPGPSPSLARALAALDAHLARHGVNFVTAAQKGELLHCLGRLAEARAWLARALADDPGEAGTAGWAEAVKRRLAACGGR